MGEFGQYLRNARESLGIDLRDAAQQTRIRLNYLKALEEENFSQLPGELFVRGFLKNYGKLLRLDEAEVMQKYAELNRPKVIPESTPVKKEPVLAAKGSQPRKRPIEPLLWGAGIFIALVIFLFVASPSRRVKERGEVQPPAETETQETTTAPVPVPESPAKLYLEVVALEKTWLAVRIDTSPMKRSDLKPGDTLIWSADKGFVLSYGEVGAIRLVLNGRELKVDAPDDATVVSLEITESGIVRAKIKQDQPNRRQPKRKPDAARKPTEYKPPPQAKPEEQPNTQPLLLFPWELRPRESIPMGRLL